MTLRSLRQYCGAVDDSDVGAKAGLPKCSFCEKTQDQVEQLIAGPKGNLFICDECVDLCKEILGGGNVQITFSSNPNVTPDAARIRWDLQTLERRLTSSVDLLAQLRDRIEADHTD